MMVHKALLHSPSTITAWKNIQTGWKETGAGMFFQENSSKLSAPYTEWLSFSRQV
jgi:hypothetical protein